MSEQPHLIQLMVDWNGMKIKWQYFSINGVWYAEKDPENFAVTMAEARGEYEGRMEGSRGCGHRQLNLGCWRDSQ